MPPRLSHRDALRILGLDAAADTAAVKRAYRRLARERHPDVGGDPEGFHQLQLAYERLVGASTGRLTRREPRGSRPRRADWADPPTKRFSDEIVDTSGLDWDTPPVVSGPVRATFERVAVLLAQPADGPVDPVAARSRGPHSPLNRMIRFLDPDLTATWTIAGARGRGIVAHDVEIRLQVWSRRARRRLDAIAAPAGWTLQRGSSSATVVRSLHPSHDRRATAIRATDSLRDLLDLLEWPLQTWVIVGPGSWKAPHLAG